MAPSGLGKSDISNAVGGAVSKSAVILETIYFDTARRQGARYQSSLCLLRFPGGTKSWVCPPWFPSICFQCTQCSVYTFKRTSLTCAGNIPSNKTVHHPDCGSRLRVASGRALWTNNDAASEGHDRCVNSDLIHSKSVILFVDSCSSYR